VLGAYAIALVPAVVMTMGAVVLIEMSYRLSTQPELGTRMRLFSVGVDAATPWPWLAAGVMVAAGFIVFRTTWPIVAAAWHQATAEARVTVKAP
jgi:branched-chain amino acid transport system permease protein